MRIDRQTYDRHVQSFPHGSAVFHEGDAGEQMFIIVDGGVEIRKSTSATATKTLVTLKKGDIFGEMALIEGKRRSATAIATAPTKLLAINLLLFESMIDQNPDFAKKMIKILSERLRATNAIIQSVLETKREHQILTGIQRYGAEAGANTFKGKRVNVKKFARWASSQLGIAEADVLQSVTALLRRGQLQDSALGDDEVILPSVRGEGPRSPRSEPSTR